MKPRETWRFLVVLLLLGGAPGCSRSPLVTPDEKAAIDIIERCGGKCNQYEFPITSVWLGAGRTATDATLARLKVLPYLQDLALEDLRISDAGLQHLRGLMYLRKLSLPRTRVSDAGLEHLKGLTNLQWLNLDGTQVSDAGLIHLEGLTNLQTLRLFGTQVTDKGVKRLRQALPNCKILANDEIQQLIDR